MHDVMLNETSQIHIKYRVYLQKCVCTHIHICTHIYTLKYKYILQMHRKLAEDRNIKYCQLWIMKSSVQFNSVAHLCLTLCEPMDCSTPGLPVHHQLWEFTQTHVHRVSDAIQQYHPLSSPSLPTFNLSQPQGLFRWVSSSHQVAKVLEFQLQHQSFQWIFRTDFL